MVSEFGDGARLKLGALTVRLTIVLLFSVPDLPRICTVDMPTGAVELDVKVSVLVVVVDRGLKVAFTPLGRPVAENVTLLWKPFCGITEIRLVSMVPCSRNPLA